MQSQAADPGWASVPSLPQTLVRRETFRLVALVSSAGDSLGVSRGELPRHGSARLHQDPAEAYMRPVLVNSPQCSCGGGALARPGKQAFSRTRLSRTTIGE